MIESQGLLLAVTLYFERATLAKIASISNIYISGLFQKQPFIRIQIL